MYNHSLVSAMTTNVNCSTSVFCCQSVIYMQSEEASAYSLINCIVLTTSLVHLLQVNVTNIGGSLSVLPRDSISIPHDAVPGMEYLDANMTRLFGKPAAQIINLRDPTRPITSFRLFDLRQGLIALQLLDIDKSIEKVRMG